MFGRERHRTHKENMGGVGTFDKECRTLYVGGLGRHKDLEELLRTEFGEWGEIEARQCLPLTRSVYDKDHTCMSELWIENRSERSLQL